MKPNNTKTISAAKGGNSGTLSRYRGLIISITVFVLLLGGLMGSSIYQSSLVTRNTNQFYVAGQMHSASIDVMKHLQALKLGYGEDPNSPHVTNTLKSLKASQELLTKALQALQQGGSFTGSDKNTVNISKLQRATSIRNLAIIEKLWKPLSTDIDNYMKTATSPTATATSLDLAVLNAQSISTRMEEATNTVSGVIQLTAQERARNLSIFQYVGIVAAFTYLAFFLFFFVRKMIKADQEADAARKETTEIMDTVNTGLFLLDKDLNLGAQYSRELEKLLGQTNLAGRNLMDVLGGMISDEDLNTTHAFIGQLYNPRTKERLIGSLNPLTRQPVTIAGSNTVRYLDFKFNRVYQDNEIARALVSVADVTDAVLLEEKIEQEREQNDVQLEMLSTILQADRRLVDDFVRNVKRHNTSVNNTLKAPGDRPNELRNKIDAIYREIHSLKGESSTLKLHGFTVLAENIETELAKLGKLPTLSGENFLGLAVYVEELMKLTQTIEDLVSRLGGSSPILPASATPAENHTLSNYYKKFVGELAERNHKQVDFSYVGIEETKHEETDTLIREIAVQLLRNAVVHGIETPDVRQAHRKLSTGHVRMELTETDDNQYSLVLEDDGKGIDYEAIRAKAVRIGQYTEEEAAKLGTKELLSLIFSSGFSTLDSSTEDAGRGVGLDIIKDRITALGGKIGVSTQAGAYTRFSFTFPKKY